MNNAHVYFIKVAQIFAKQDYILYIPRGRTQLSQIKSRDQSLLFSKKKRFQLDFDSGQKLKATSSGYIDVCM